MPLADVNDVYTDLVTTLFSPTIAAKAWFAPAAVVLAIVQVTTAARMWGRLEFLPLGGPIAARVVASGLDAEEVATTIAKGRGVMPPALVSGQEQADVVAYVVSIAR